MTTINEHHLPVPVVEKLRESLMRLKTITVANRLWNKGFSDQDRQKLGGDLHTAYKRFGTVGMWRELRGGTLERAIVEASSKLSFLNDFDRDWLLGELGETLKPPGRSDKPRWDPIGGELSLEGHIIRTVRTFRRPSNVQQILGEFQQRRWRKKIENPLKEQRQQQLHQALRSLNKGLQRITFHSGDGGKSIHWTDR